MARLFKIIIGHDKQGNPIYAPKPNTSINDLKNNSYIPLYKLYKGKGK